MAYAAALPRVCVQRQGEPSRGCSHTCDQSTPKRSKSNCNLCIVARCLRRSSLSATSSAPSRNPPRQPPVRSRPEVGRPGRPSGCK
eukprot:scaffold132498_cov28-Tisochrysis_lutea.AAC.7